MKNLETANFTNYHRFNCEKRYNTGNRVLLGLFEDEYMAYSHLIQYRDKNHLDGKLIVDRVWNGRNSGDCYFYTACFEAI